MPIDLLLKKCFIARGAQLKSFSLEKLDYFCSDNALVEALVKVFKILTR